MSAQRVVERIVDDVPSLEDWLKQQKPTHLECRRWGHAWMKWRYQQFPEAGVNSRTILRCQRCSSKAFEDLMSDGTTERRLEYADGYLAPRGFGRLTRTDRAQLRLHADQLLAGDTKIKPISGGRGRRG